MKPFNENHNKDLTELAWLPDGIGRPQKLSPFSGFLIKVASRCNLNCSYCYVYQSPDKSYLTKPKFLSIDIARKTAARIEKHALKHKLDHVDITFHGGEPLLAGPERLRQYIIEFSNLISCETKFSLQTNATLFTPEILDILAEAGATIGMSIDGDQESNNRNRYFRNGTGSYNRIMQGINLLKSKPKWEKMLSGGLVVIDLDNEPDAIYDELLRLKLPNIDFLLPDSHHSAPPKRFLDNHGIDYALWLERVFYRWYHEKDDRRFSVDLFMDIMTMLLGGNSVTESIGNNSVDFIIIDTNGDIEALDVLKIVGRSATYLGLNVLKNDFDDAMSSPAIYSRNIGNKSLCEICRKCEVVEICGGGYLPHRYSAENGFMNPSVYCADLMYLINLIDTVMKETYSAYRSPLCGNIRDGV